MAGRAGEALGRGRRAPRRPPPRSARRSTSALLSTLRPDREDAPRRRRRARRDGREPDGRLLLVQRPAPAAAPLRPPPLARDPPVRELQADPLLGRFTACRDGGPARPSLRRRLSRQPRAPPPGGSGRLRASNAAGLVGRTTNNVAEWSGLPRRPRRRDRGRGPRRRDPRGQRARRQAVQRGLPGEGAHLARYLVEAKEKARKIPRLRVVHVRREENREADRLANEALDGARG